MLSIVALGLWLMSIHVSSISPLCSDEGLALFISAFKGFYDGKFLRRGESYVTVIEVHTKNILRIP